MIRDGISYLSRNTDITYFGEGSTARALIESVCLEISRLQDYVSSISDNSFLSTASGIYLDLFGEMLGVERKSSAEAFSTVQDGSVRFYVQSGTLGSILPHPSDPKKGLISRGTRVSTLTGSVEYTVTDDTEFPRNAKSAYVPVRAYTKGAESNVGVNQLVAHSLDSSIKVTNDVAITTGSDTESDVEYRYRLSKAMTTKFSANSTSIQVAASTQPGIATSKVFQYARGAGTFDVLLIPRGNKLTDVTRASTERIINSIAAYGISSKVREPEYKPFKISIQLRFRDNTSVGTKANAKQAVESALLAYMGQIPLGGEVVINQIRSNTLSASDSIIDMKILELCVDGSPRTIRNFTLNEDELLIPDRESGDPVKVV